MGYHALLQGITCSKCSLPARLPASFKQTGYDANGKITGYYNPTGNIPMFVEKLRKKGDLQLDMSVFVPQN